MKRTVLVAVIALASVLAFTNVHSDAEMVEATSQISGVTVFMDAGLVKRAATADVKAGYSLVKVSGLPRWVSSNNTIVRGSGDFTLISTEFRTLWKKDAPTKQIETLLKEKDELLAKLEEHSITLKVLEQEESVYKSLAPSAISANELPDELKQLSAEDSQKLLDTVEKGLTSVYERKLENDIAVR
ncbi:MAG: DUF4140 domain-containing protein [Planctomycetota bacterium]|nr:DUF4140 domain-containing protein [Planctomycetota bacterium]